MLKKQLTLTNEKINAAISALKAEGYRKRCQWIDFCGFVHDLWFQGKISWEVSEVIENAAWELETSRQYSSDEKEMIFAVVKDEALARLA